MKTALVIGDSHVDTTDAYLKNKKTANFGLILAGKLAAQGYTVTTAGVGGSTVASWLGDTVSRSGKQVKPGELPKSPDLLIVVLGSNDMGRGADPAKVVANYVTLVNRFQPKRVLWVGPPQMRSSTGYNNANMAKLYAAAGGSIFDSRPSTRAAVDAGDGDGIHSGPASAEAWAGAVASSAGDNSMLWIVGLGLGLGLAYAAWRRRK